MREWRHALAHPFSEHIDAVAPLVTCRQLHTSRKPCELSYVKTGPIAEPEEYGQETKRDNVGGRHSWFLTDGKGVYVPSDARKAQAG